MYKNSSLKSHKEHKMVCLAKGTKIPKYCKPSSINILEDNTNATDIDNDDTSICTDLSDLDLSSDGSDLGLANPPNEIIQIYISDRQQTLDPL